MSNFQKDQALASSCVCAVECIYFVNCNAYGGFYQPCAWTLILLMFYALAFTYTFPQISRCLLMLYSLYHCYSLLFFTLIENKVHYLKVLFKIVFFFFFCTELKDLGFVCISVAFMTPKCDFFQKCSAVAWYVLKMRRNRMEAVQNQCETCLKMSYLYFF